MPKSGARAKGKDRSAEYARRAMQDRSGDYARRQVLRRARQVERNQSKRPAAAARSTSRSRSGSPWADRLLADLKPIDFVQVFKKLGEDKRYVLSRLFTSSLVKYGEFLELDTTSMSREELIEELLLQVDRAPLL